ncbi:hypothetical protein DTW90_37200 [Neorhizobium sp. P12A]|nr:hypothetical protein DTW90_37200 [Neorhizobium sp. P12A]
MAGRILGSLLAFAALAFFSATSNAVESAPLQFHVKLALILDGKQPILGDVDCISGRECSILNNTDPSILLTITTDRQLYEDDQITIACTPQCSFLYGRSSTQAKGTAEFDLFSGADLYDPYTLVLKKRPTIGKLFLIY